MSWILYALGFLAVLTSAMDDPRLARNEKTVFLLAVIWPIVVLGLLLARVWRIFRHG